MKLRVNSINFLHPIQHIHTSAEKDFLICCKHTITSTNQTLHQQLQMILLDFFYHSHIYSLRLTYKLLQHEMINKRNF